MDLAVVGALLGEGTACSRSPASKRRNLMSEQPLDEFPAPRTVPSQASFVKAGRNWVDQRLRRRANLPLASRRPHGSFQRTGRHSSERNAVVHRLVLAAVEPVDRVPQLRSNSTGLASGAWVGYSYEAVPQLVVDLGFRNDEVVLAHFFLAFGRELVWLGFEQIDVSGVRFESCAGRPVCDVSFP